MTEPVTVTKPSVDRYMGVSRDQIVDFGKNGKFRVLVFGAYNAMGLIGPEINGIAILQEDPARVVTDAICKQDSGYFGPSQAQLDLFDEIVKMSWKKFQALVNESERARFTL